MAGKRASFRDKYRKQKKDLQKRHQESVNNKDAGMYGSVFDKTKLNNRTFWKCGEAKHTIDIIPFVCGDNMPAMQNTEAGETSWFLDLWVHRGVGVLGHPYPCLALNWGEKCPICEELQNNRDKYTEDDWKAAKAKRRSMYLIWSHTTPSDEEKGIQIWDVAHWFMEDKLSEISIKPKGGGTIAYYDIDTGKHVMFTRRGTGATNTQYLGHAFYDRDEPEIPDYILDQTFELDMAVIHPTYKELYEVFHQSAPEEEEEVVDEPPETEPDPEPEDDSPIVGDDECPGGGTMGVDIEQLEECKTCVNWDPCEEEADRLEAQDVEPEPEPEPEPPKEKKRLRRKSSEPEKKEPVKRRRRRG
jgi:hypothetical protein